MVRRVREVRSDEAAPYRDLLFYELQVDGKRADSYRDAQGWPLTVHYGGSSLGRGLDRVVSARSPRPAGVFVKVP